MNTSGSSRKGKYVVSRWYVYGRERRRNGRKTYRHEEMKALNEKPN
jgi:hypothetical protein